MGDIAKQPEMTTEELARLSELLNEAHVQEAIGLLARSRKTVASVKAAVPIFDYILRLWGVFSFARQSCKSYEIAGEQLAFDALSGAADLLQTDIDKIDPEVTEENREERINLVLRRFSEGFAETRSKNAAWVCNYSFVFLCTVLETFFEQLLRSILHVNSELLNDEKITFGQAAHPKGQDLVHDMVERRLSSFALLGLIEKIELLTSKYNLPESRLFDYSDVSPDKEYVGWDRGKLKELVALRNDVVHRDALAITEINGLYTIARFYEFLIVRLSLMAGNIYGVSISYRKDET